VSKGLSRSESEQSRGGEGRRAPLPSHKFMNGDAKSEPIGRDSMRVARGNVDLRGLSRSEGGSRRGRREGNHIAVSSTCASALIVWREKLGHAKVCQFDVPVIVEENILRLDVTWESDEGKWRKRRREGGEGMDREEGQRSYGG
jgi:hypothetical protein